MHKNEAYTRALKKVSANFGLEISGIYAVLIDIYEYLKPRNLLTRDGYFYVTVPTLERITTLKKKKQYLLLKKMEELGMIHTTSKGFPSKRYIKLLPFDVSSLSYSFTDEEMKEEYGIEEDTVGSNGNTYGVEREHLWGQMGTPMGSNGNTIENIIIKNRYIENIIIIIKNEPNKAKL